MAKDAEKPIIPEGAPASVSTAIPREKLPDDLQELLNRQDSFFDELYDGELPETTESSVRYAAYANRLRTIMLSAHRYVAYTSDIGESFRPIAHPGLVRTAYGISWAYLIGDVSHESWKAYKRNQKLMHPENNEHMRALSDGDEQKQKILEGRAVERGQKVHIPAIEDWRAVGAQRAVFQSIASMGLPAFTIHSIVRYSGRALKNAKNTTIRTWGPIAVPALPYMFDKPVEEAVEYVFHTAFKAIGGPGAVSEKSHDREEDIAKDNKKLKEL
ncbi:hypothetical protein MRB53_040123 [Persea americana]|nr:hypothetical protein MRB53_040123 [Persea americana]